MTLNNQVSLEQDSLFKEQALPQDENKMGFRLQKLEVYNWGTFDEDIWSFTPQGNTTLLTGESGSGKSTLVDALITLLVPLRNIAYNKAADASAKERSILSYVRGYYGQKYAYEGKGTPEALRDHREYTVILATLGDAAFKKTVSLAAFFWFRVPQGNPSRFYALAHRELFIDKDFSHFQGDVKRLKARLRSGGIEVFDEYSHYGEHFRRALGGLSSQAIDLFQQTVSMKKVAALTDFVRDHMLEEKDIKDDINNLLRHYHNLNSTYEAVQQARKKISLLQPICTNSHTYSRKQDELGELMRGENALDFWFATLKEELYQQCIAGLIKEAALAQASIEQEQKRRDDIDGEIRFLDKEIYQNGGGALEELKKTLQRKTEALGRLQKDYGRYCGYAETLGLVNPDSLDIFMENHKWVEMLSQKLPEKKKIAEKDLANVSIKLEKECRQKADIDEEIASLQERTSNIPKDLINLRRRMCNALSISEAQLPFAGELLEVKDGELEWEGAIERLLHSFALGLLVPKQHYGAVSKWVNEQHLGARLVYFSTTASPAIPPAMLPDTVGSKLAVKELSPFSGWLIKELADRFPHICCRDIAQFRREKRAITLGGQIKSITRHEKDDRRNLTDRTRYVLGFSNQKKIEVLAAQSTALAQEIKGSLETQGYLSELNNALAKQINSLLELDKFTEFAEIDVQGALHEHEACRQSIAELSLQASDVLTKLQEQLKQAQQERQLQQEKLTRAIKKEAIINNDLQEKRAKQSINRALLEQESPLEQLSYAYLEKNRQRWLGDSILTLENCADQEKQYAKGLRDEGEKLQRSINDLSSSLVKSITEFRHQFPLETKEIDDSVEALPEYHRMLDTLLKDDLPRYEQKFKEMLTSQVLQQIAIFQATLDEHYKNVKARIQSINSSLYSIDYNPSRYIEIICEDNRDGEIKSFRAQLKACTEGSIGGLDSDNMSAERFLQIKKIIERFSGRERESETDKKWTKKVTDVRNWFLFSASERWRDTDEEYEHYTDSGGKSGGQKEKLAYTILAASLVYNYGLHETYEEQPTFRLVVIDEAFLKSSDDSATYGLKLFEQLKFQLVIVTPLLKISTIEPFIAHVGFVSHNDISHKSSIMNIPIQVYQEKRKSWEDLQNA